MAIETIQASDDQWLQHLLGGVDMPGRKIRPSRYSITGYVSTTKAAHAQDAESSLEHDFMTLLEYDRRVERFIAQPFTISWKDEANKRRRYTPDTIVKYSYLAMEQSPSLRTTIFEVKPLAILRRDWAELRPKFKAAIGWARDYGCIFHIVTEREIRTPYLENVRFLLGYRSYLLDDRPGLVGERQHLIRETLARLRVTTPRKLLEEITSDMTLRAELIPWIWNLVNQKLVGVDLNKKLTMASPIWLPGHQPIDGEL